MDIEKRELWNRLENEPERAYRAFECFLSFPSGERTLLEAYRRHVGNPDAAKPSDTWSGWSSSLLANPLAINGVAGVVDVVYIPSRSTPTTPSTPFTKRRAGS